MKKTIVFIMSCNYSGSHFLSQLLGSHSKAMHIGEVKNVIREDNKCYVCGDTGRCKIFNGLENVPKEKLYPTIFDRAPEGVHILVDNSKKVGWVKDFLCLQGEYNLKFIYLVRDPRALTRRWFMAYKTVSKRRKVRLRAARKNISHCAKILLGDQANTYVYKWLDDNRKLTRFIQGSGIESKTITYYELATDTPATLTKLCDFLDIEYEEGQIEYWKFEHHGTQKSEYEWIKENNVKSYFDTRWKEYLTKQQIDIIQQNGSLHEFLHEQNLVIGEDGLTLKRS